MKEAIRQVAGTGHHEPVPPQPRSNIVSENEDPDMIVNPMQPCASTGRQVSVPTELSKALTPMSFQCQSKCPYFQYAEHQQFENAPSYSQLKQHIGAYYQALL